MRMHLYQISGNAQEPWAPQSRNQVRLPYPCSYRPPAMPLMAAPVTPLTAAPVTPLTPAPMTPLTLSPAPASTPTTSSTPVPVTASTQSPTSVPDAYVVASTPAPALVEPPSSPSSSSSSSVPLGAVIGGAVGGVWRCWPLPGGSWPSAAGTRVRRGAYWRRRGYPQCLDGRRVRCSPVPSSGDGGGRNYPVPSDWC